MNGIIIAPDKKSIIITPFDEKEKRRIEQIHEMLGTDKNLTVIPYEKDLLYYINASYKDIPEGYAAHGFYLGKSKIILGRGIILGVKDGKDRDFTSDIHEIASTVTPHEFKRSDFEPTDDA